jgi:hypothetical protein
VAPDTLTAYSLLKFARYDFDLSELYARKLRKKLFEEKGAFSDASFFKPIFDQIQNEYSERRTQAVKDTELGIEAEQLARLHADVLKEIAEYPDYCKTCKPLKKKK